MDDLINRQSTLDALDKHFESFIKRFGYDSYERADEKTKLVCDGLSEAEDVIMELPSAQPEIIRCKDCKQFRRWIDTDICFCDITEAEMSDNDFCSKAERWEE